MIPTWGRNETSEESFLAYVENSKLLTWLSYYRAAWLKRTIHRPSRFQHHKALCDVYSEA